MHCDLAREQLALMALGEAPADGGLALGRHLAQCPRCRAVTDQYQLLVAQLSSAGQDGLADAGPSDSLLQAVAGEMARARKRRWFVRWPAVAAAILLLAGSAGALLLTRGLLHNSQPQAVAPPASAVPVLAGELWQKVGARAVPAAPADAVLIHRQNIYMLLDQPRTALASFDTDTGQLRWQREMPTVGCLSADAQRVYCLATSGGQLGLVALSADDGRLLWNFPADAAWRVRQPRPALATGQRVYWTADRTVFALDTDGRKLWERTVEDEGLISAPVQSGEALCVASATAIYWISPGDGTLLQRRDLEQRGNAYDRPLLAVSQDELCVARMVGRADQILCMDANGGPVRWSRVVPMAGHLLLANGRLYVRGLDVRAMDLSDGRELWQLPADGCGPMSIIDGVLCFADGSGEGALRAVDPASGRAVWQQEGLRSCDALLRQGRLGYLKTRDGVVHAMVLPGRT